MKKLILFSLFMLFSRSSFAQIAITDAEFLAGYATGITQASDAYTTTDLSGAANLVALKGAGANWNFGGATYTKETTSNTGISLVDPLTAPLHEDVDFQGATHCIKIKAEGDNHYDSYSYVKITSDGMFGMGIVGDSSGTSIKLNSYSPPTQQMKFPLTYGTSWTSTSTVHTAFDIPGYTQTMKIEADCDGWGTLQLPTRAQKKDSPTGINDCLRVRTKETYTTSVASFNIVTASHQYEWFTESSNSASISSDSTDVPTAMSYGQASSSSGVDNATFENSMVMRLSANPTSNQTTLSYNLPESGDVKVSMMDNLGREVKMLHNGFAPAGSNAIPIDPSIMANGTYLIRVSSNSFTGTRKLIIAK